MPFAKATASARGVAAAIAAQGFRAWYERELIRGHAHLVLLLLCAVAAMGAVEAFSLQRGPQRWWLVGSLVVAAVLGWHALRRYLYHLAQAEALARQADCPHCGVYARWRVESCSVPPGAPTAVAVGACCRACGGRWTVHCL